MATVFRHHARVIEKVGEIVDVLVGHQHDVAAVAAVAAIRAAVRNILLAPKADAAVAAATSLDFNGDAIDKHRNKTLAFRL